MKGDDTAAAADAAGGLTRCGSVFDAAPTELEVGMDALSVSALAPAAPPPQSPPQQQEQVDATASPSSSPSPPSIPSRLLSSLPSYLLPAFLVGGFARGGGTFKPLKQHSVR